VGEKDAYEPRARHCFRPPADQKRGRAVEKMNTPDLKYYKNRVTARKEEEQKNNQRSPDADP
jgi:thymidine kinase